MTTVHRVPVRNIWSGVVALGILAGTLLLAQDSHLHGPACLFRLVTKVPCPGCGLTRSLSALWHGDFLLAFRYHPLGFLTFAICLYLVFSGWIAPRFPRLQRRCEVLERAVMKPSLLYGVVALLIALWLTRLTLAHYGNTFFVW